MTTVPPAQSVQVCEVPIGTVGGIQGPKPITVLGEATMDPKITGGA
ncbi:MAG: hypothetical protein R8M14_04015 [Ghiorsea sp.]